MNPIGRGTPFDAFSKSRNTPPLQNKLGQISVNIGQVSVNIGKAFSARKNKKQQKASKDVLHDPIIQKITHLTNFSVKGSVAGIYITSNEANFRKVQSQLSNEAPKDNACHIGFSGWYNFDVVATRKSSYAVVCDFNPQNQEFLAKTLHLLKKSTNREEFVNYMVDYLDTSKISFSPNLNDDMPEYSEGYSPQEEVRRELTRDGSWLASDETFEYIKSLAENDKFALITEDVRNTKTFKKIAKILKKNRLQVDTLYLSNISKYMSGKDRNKFVKTVEALSPNDSIIVNCPIIRSIDGKSYSVYQQVFHGNEIKAKPELLFEIPSE